MCQTEPQSLGEQKRVRDPNLSALTMQSDLEGRITFHHRGYPFCTNGVPPWLKCAIMDYPIIALTDNKRSNGTT